MRFIFCLGLAAHGVDPLQREGMYWARLIHLAGKSAALTESATFIGQQQAPELW